MKCSNFALSGHSGKFKGSNTRQYIFLHKSHFPNTHIHKPCIPIISKRASKKKKEVLIALEAAELFRRQLTLMQGSNVERQDTTADTMMKNQILKKYFHRLSSSAYSSVSLVYNGVYQRMHVQMHVEQRELECISASLFN